MARAMDEVAWKRVSTVALASLTVIHSLLNGKNEVVATTHGLELALSFAQCLGAPCAIQLIQVYAASSGTIIQNKQPDSELNSCIIGCSSGGTLEGQPACIERETTFSRGSFAVAFLSSLADIGRCTLKGEVPAKFQYPCKKTAHLCNCAAASVGILFLDPRIAIKGLWSITIK